MYPPTAVKSADPRACGESWTVSTDPNIRRYGTLSHNVPVLSFVHGYKALILKTFTLSTINDLTTFSFKFMMLPIYYDYIIFKLNKAFFQIA